MNTLGSRLRKIEESIIDQLPDNSLLGKIKKKDDIRKKNELDKLNESYRNHLIDNVTDVSEHNMLSVLIFAIKYVEQNVDSISKLASVKASRDFENLTIQSLIECDYPMYNDEFIINCILSVRMLLDNQIKEPVLDLPVNNEMVVAKKGLFRKNTISRK